MNLYEMIERTLTCRWLRGDYNKVHPVHYWPREGSLTRPHLTMVSPHEGKYSLIDFDEKKTYTVDIDEVVLALPGTTLQVHQPTEGRQTYVHLEYSMLGDFNPWSLFTLPRTYRGKKGDLVREAMMYVSESHNTPADSLQVIAARKESVFKLFRVLVGMATLRSEKVTLLNGFSRIEPVVAHIREHLAEPITRQELAELAHLSPSRLNVVFKETMGMAPKQYIQDLRHRRAVDLLQDTNLSVGQIADKCGFCDQFEFSRQFKKRWGAPPLAYRRMLREQDIFFDGKK